MSLYCSDDDLMILLQEELPKVLSDDPDLTVVGSQKGVAKRRKALILPASAWIDSVYGLTAPFPIVSGINYEPKRLTPDGGPDSDHFLSTKEDDQAIILRTNPDGNNNPDCIKEFDTRNRIFGKGDRFPEEGPVDGLYIVIEGTPSLVRQATIEYAMSLAWAIMNRYTKTEIIVEWRKQAMQTIGVKDGYATKRPHPYIPHNTGVASLL